MHTNLFKYYTPHFSASPGDPGAFRGPPDDFRLDYVDVDPVPPEEEFLPNSIGPDPAKLAASAQLVRVASAAPTIASHFIGMIEMKPRELR